MDYNRVIKDMNGLSQIELLDKLVGKGITLERI